MALAGSEKARNAQLSVVYKHPFNQHHVQLTHSKPPRQILMHFVASCFKISKRINEKIIVLISAYERICINKALNLMLFSVS